MEATDQTGKIIWTNAIFLAITPFLAVAAGAWYFATQTFSWTPIIAAVALYFVAGMSITVAYHRLFSHRTYKASPILRAIFAVTGASAWQNSIIEWASDHRRHHLYVDTDDDPYNAHRGFWYSHIFWICIRGRHDGDLSNVKDLFDDPICAWQHRHYWSISIAFNVLVPVLLGWLTGDVLSMVIWAGLIRVVVVHHTTFLINSSAHMFGTQPYSDHNTARDSWWLAFLTHGEGYHNYHHAFEKDYRNGRSWYDWDPSKWLIAAFAKVGLAQDLRRVPDDMVLRRRFEEGRSRFVDDLESWGKKWDAWKEEVRAGAQDALGEHLLHAEERIDAALKDLRKKRAAWQKAVRDNQSKATIRSMKKACRSAQRSISSAMAEWEAMMGQYAQSMTPQAA
ncbi:MAG: fatty acid desaturase [Myxococcota bacterium]|nr:fatty acid desaturase [Myxococcota bacterium]